MDLKNYILTKSFALKELDEPPTVKWTSELRLREALKELAEKGSLEDLLSVLR